MYHICVWFWWLLCLFRFLFFLPFCMPLLYKFVCWGPNIQCDSIWRWSLWEVIRCGTLVMGLVPIYKETPENLHAHSLSLSYHMRTQREGSHLKVRKRALTGTKPNLGLLVQCTAKPVHWHWVVVQESIAFIVGCQTRRIGSSCLKDLNSPTTFREGFLKTVWERVCTIHAQFFDWLMIR